VSSTVVALVDVTAFVCVTSPSSPGLTMRIEMETLQYEHSMSMPFTLAFVEGVWSFDSGI
jgi:hypothetical protein